jgi:hypothetical protein
MGKRQFDLAVVPFRGVNNSFNVGSVVARGVYLFDRLFPLLQYDVQSA